MRTVYDRGRVLAATLAAVLGLLVPAIEARASENATDAADAEASSTANAAAPDTAAPAPAKETVEDQIRLQRETLLEMKMLLEKQQAEIQQLRKELDDVRAGTAAPAGAAPASAVAAGTPGPGLPSATATSAVATAAGGAIQAPAAAQDDSLKKQVDELAKRFGNLKISGDLRFRYETLFNQGFDAPVDVKSRTRERIRLRVQLTGDIGKHFDWGVRIASGSFDDPTSTNSSFTDFFDRKPFAVDRAFLHFNTKSNPVELDVLAGKFDIPWKHTSVTFDPDVNAEGLTESVIFRPKHAGPLSDIRFIAWQLPIKERAIGADAYIFGGQLQTNWKWNDEWSSSLSGTFHDFEQANLIAQNSLVSPTLVNSGLELPSTNTLVINPFTGLVEYASKYRVANAIGDVTYTGWGSRWPLVLKADWVHNTSAFNNQKDGGTLQALVGRASEEEDLQFGYYWWKVERDAFPSAFMESDVTLQTNSLAHVMSASYMLRKQIQLQWNYYLTRRLQSTAVENRWLNRFQFDVIYKF